MTDYPGPRRACPVCDGCPLDVVLMGPHDIANINGTIVTCACGAKFAALGLDKAKAKHETHFQIERARAALKGGGGASPTA